MWCVRFLYHYVVYYNPRSPFCQDVLANNMLQKTGANFMDSAVFLLFLRKALTKRTECVWDARKRKNGKNRMPWNDVCHDRPQKNGRHPIDTCRIMQYTAVKNHRRLSKEKRIENLCKNNLKSETSYYYDCGNVRMYSHSTIDAAMEAFRLSVSPVMGMRITSEQAAMISGAMPCPSLPMTTQSFGISGV